MWTAYPAIARRRSQGAGPSVLPTSTYPPEMYETRPPTTSTSTSGGGGDPRTPPPVQRGSLSRVEETEMEESLVARDYALSNPQSQSQAEDQGSGTVGGRGMEKEKGKYKSKSPYDFSQTDTEDDGSRPQSGSHSRSMSQVDMDGPRARRRSSGLGPGQQTGGPSAAVNPDTTSPAMIPPESIHDAYLSKYIEPIQTSTHTKTPNADTNNNNSDSNARPAVARSTSTPAPAGLLISPISLKSSASPIRGLGMGMGADPHSHINPQSTTTKGQGPERGKDGRPIFEIFNAELSEGSEGMVKALKGHLEDVLRVQEEIGRMHLDLEGLGERGRHERNGGDGEGGRGAESPVKGGKEGKGGAEDELLKREKGVDELMERLATLSNNLRTYHDFGTPTLSFSHSQPNTALESDPQSHSNAPPPLNRLHSANPDILTTSPDMLSPSPPRAEVPRSLPTRTPVAVHKGIDDLRRQEGLPSRRPTVRYGQDLDISTAGAAADQAEQNKSQGQSSSHGQRQVSANSDLSPLHLSMDDYEIRNAPGPASASGGEGKRSIQKKTSASFSDLAALQRDREREREREKGLDNWMEYGLDLGPAPDQVDVDRRSGHGSLRSGAGATSRRAQSRAAQGRTVDSPIEMMDRTRPW